MSRRSFTPLVAPPSVLLAVTSLPAPLVLLAGASCSLHHRHRPSLFSSLAVSLSFLSSLFHSLYEEAFDCGGEEEEKEEKARTIGQRGVATIINHHPLSTKTKCTTVGRPVFLWVDKAKKADEEVKEKKTWAPFSDVGSSNVKDEEVFFNVLMQSTSVGLK
ncbi:hypothetical protein Scep_022124 [Stephania cephalantha]|uniref:Uncharacterized protein n=1 Tax=Stephania cephalantha TaxID=152367 RepID=A0AAP0F4S0_9MAGN